jgi:hypothetical protein
MNPNSEIEQCIHQKLKQEADQENLIKRNKLFIMLGYYYHIPKESRGKVITELQDKGMIKVISKFEIKVI